MYVQNILDYLTLKNTISRNTLRIRQMQGCICRYGDPQLPILLCGFYHVWHKETLNVTRVLSFINIFIKFTSFFELKRNWMCFHHLILFLLSMYCPVAGPCEFKTMFYILYVYVQASSERRPTKLGLNNNLCKLILTLHWTPLEWITQVIWKSASKISRGIVFYKTTLPFKLDMALDSLGEILQWHLLWYYVVAIFACCPPFLYTWRYDFTVVRACIM